MRIETVPRSSDRLAAGVTEAPCPFCAHRTTVPCCDTRGEDGTSYHVRRCGDCGTAFLSPPPSDEQLRQAYASEYYGQGDTKFGSPIERLRDAFASRRVRRFTRGLAPGARILDVGCGDGRLLRRFQNAGRYELHGIELPGRAAERAAKVPGIQLHVGSLDSVDLPPAEFNLITLVHVFEHLPAPRETLDRLARLTRPGGRLFISYPNIGSWQARWGKGDWFHLDPPRHLTLAPPPTVVSHLQSRGLQLLSERHLCLEQNTYGWIQTALNRCDSRRNFLYERLKRNDAYVPTRGPGSVALHAAGGGILLAPALLLDLASALFLAGATVELTFGKTAT